MDCVTVRRSFYLDWHTCTLAINAHYPSFSCSLVSRSHRWTGDVAAAVLLFSRCTDNPRHRLTRPTRPLGRLSRVFRVRTDPRISKNDSHSDAGPLGLASCLGTRRSCFDRNSCAPGHVHDCSVEKPMAVHFAAGVGGPWTCRVRAFPLSGSMHLRSIHYHPRFCRHHQRQLYQCMDHLLRYNPFFASLQSNRPSHCLYQHCDPNNANCTSIKKASPRPGYGYKYPSRECGLCSEISRPCVYNLTPNFSRWQSWR